MASGVKNGEEYQELDLRELEMASAGFWYDPYWIGMPKEDQNLPPEDQNLPPVEPKQVCQPIPISTPNIYRCGDGIHYIPNP